MTKKNALKAETKVSKWAEWRDNVLSLESGSGWEKEETWTESFERRKQRNETRKRVCSGVWKQPADR